MKAVMEGLCSSELLWNSNNLSIPVSCAISFTEMSLQDGMGSKKTHLYLQVHSIEKQKQYL